MRVRVGQRGKAQLDDLLGALADLTLNTHTDTHTLSSATQGEWRQAPPPQPRTLPTWISGVRVGRSKVNTEVDPEVRRSTLSRLL